MRVVSSKGVAAVTFDAIGKEAGYSRGLVTQRFGSKDGLIGALIDGLHRWQQEALDDADVESMDGLSALCAFVELHSQSLGEREEYKAYFMLLSAAVADRLETRTAFAESHELERVLIRSLIERGQEEGSIQAGINADATALMTGCSLLGMRMQKMIDPSTDIAPIKNALIQSLCARLAPDEEGESR